VGIGRRTHPRSWQSTEPQAPHVNHSKLELLRLKYANAKGGDIFEIASAWDWNIALCCHR